jgi:succinate dehydrogenase hydrophobic anchor subunit
MYWLLQSKNMSVQQTYCVVRQTWTALTPLALFICAQFHLRFGLGCSVETIKSYEMTFTKTTIALCRGIASSLAMAGGFGRPPGIGPMKWQFGRRYRLFEI